MRLTKDEIMAAIVDEDWQAFRRMLKGWSTPEKLSALRGWLDEHQHGRTQLIQVQNYLNALARGGQIRSTTVEALESLF